MPMPPDDDEKRKKKKRRPNLRLAPSDEMACRSDLLTAVREMNSKHAVVMVGGKCVVATRVLDPIFGRPDLQFVSFQDFKHYHSNRYIDVPNGSGEIKRRPLADVWITSGDRVTYKGIVFSPARDVEGYLNLWQGFPLEARQGDWSLMQAHILNAICGGDVNHFNYLMTWMADCVQNPGGERPGVAVVLRGKKGSGKGVFVTALGRIFGSHFLHITQGGQLTGKFNSHLKNAILVFCDEAFWAGDRSAEGVLKGMITEDLLQIEHKGKDSFSVRNNVRLIIASNESWVVPASVDERRFFCLDVDDHRAQDHDYFARLVHDMANGGTEAMFYDLQRWGLGMINLRDAPRTESLAIQIIQGLRSTEKWFFCRMVEGRQILTEDEWLSMVITQDLHKDYLLFCEQIGERYPDYDVVFSKNLRSMNPEIMACRYRFDGKINRALRFPDLEFCRNHFALKAGISIDWELEERKFDGSLVTGIYDQ